MKYTANCCLQSVKVIQQRKDGLTLLKKHHSHGKPPATVTQGWPLPENRPEKGRSEICGGMVTIKCLGEGGRKSS